MSQGELEAFDAEGRALLRVVRGLSAAELDLPTNCPPWNLAELIVHIAGSLQAGRFPSAEPGAVSREPADYYRRPERDTPEYRDRNVRLAQEDAEHVLERTTVSEHLAASLRDTEARMTSDDLDRVVDVPRVGPMQLRGWIATRVISLAAHGLDVAISLGREPWTTPSALLIMRPIFHSLLGRTMPDELEWSDQRLLAVSTGRDQLTGAERTELGSDAARFPLLS